jgi:hypothetical protein
MINVNQITSQLAKMPDQALQQYAMMHKNDPYTVSLALSESNRRKQMRDAAQGQQGMGEQPKVVDQGIAEMMAPAPQPQMPQAQAQPMPEDVGIGALPAPNMQGMAEGGIVAFGPGGSVGNIPDITSMSAAEAKEYAQRLLNERNARAAFTVPTSVTPAATPASGSYLKGMGSGALKAASPFAILGQHLFGTSEEEKQALAKGDPEYAAYLAAEAAKTPEAKVAAPVVTPGVTPTGVSGGPTHPATYMPEKAAAAGDRKEGVDTLLASRAARAAPEKDFMSQYEAARKDRKVTDPYAKEETDLQAAEEAAGKKRLSSFEADVKEKGDVYAKREARIGKREEELGKQKDSNTGMAFLEAGLAMMQSKGQGLAGIAEGAGVGVKSYSAGIDKLKTAQEKLDDARDKMEELRQNEASMDKRERRSLEADIDKTVNQGKRAYLGAQRALLSKDEALTQTAVASDVAAQGRQAQMRSAENIAANANNRAIMMDARADERARLSAAQTLMKESGDMLSGSAAMNLSDKEKATYLADYNSAKALLQKMGGTMAAAPAPAPTAAAGWGKPTVITP